MLDHDEGDLPFQPANITFTDVSYSVKSSISNDTIELLKGVDGYFVAGKMTALMGSSGAGKTTLMDVLALRKTSGELKGEIRLNGHLQNSNSFRRCTGYVEQFDFQSAQLTVKETIMFSSKMRLDRNDPVVTEAAILKFVDKTMKMLELHSIQDLVVGCGVGNGLSFEQKKRLGIAVEVAANPSILFLDEPTSGLDSSAAAIVMKGLKRIADSGRAVCATIHQPSVAIFNSFDNLLLLKRGGEVVFFGELGHESKKLIDYFEHFETTRKIRSNENPETWMLNTIGSGTKTSEASKMDYALAYDGSRLHRECLEKISEFCALKSDSNEIHFSTKYANDFWYQAKKVYSRLSKVYWRSPSYNRTRLIVGAVISLLFGSVYASQRVITSEIQLNSICNSIYISVLFLGKFPFL
jgi:ABC-type multidrug transport system ATPase subunit